MSYRYNIHRQWAPAPVPGATHAGLTPTAFDMLTDIDRAWARMTPADRRDVAAEANRRIAKCLGRGQ